MPGAEVGHGLVSALGLDFPATTPFFLAQNSKIRSTSGFRWVSETKTSCKHSPVPHFRVPVVSCRGTMAETAEAWGMGMPI